MVEDAVLIGPVSNLKFPANREINREFCRVRALSSNSGRQSAREFNDLQPNSLHNGNREFLVA